MAQTTKTRVMEITTPLGDDVLLFHRMGAREELSRLFEYNIGLLSTKPDVNLDKIMGHNVTVKLELPEKKTRFYNGYVTRFAQMGTMGRYYAYHATVRPWLWFLTRRRNCRIFQDMTVPEIIKKVFDDHKAVADVDDAPLSERYSKWNYCVQYRETDFDFVSRLMEQEGIYYYFKHAEKRHTLVIADSFSAHNTTEGYEKIPFIPAGSSTLPKQEHITDWTLEREIQPGRFVMDDYNFETPSVELESRTQITRNHEMANYEVYDYPGEFDVTGDGERYVKTRLEEIQAQFETFQAQSNARGVTVGSLFSLEGHTRSDQNRKYLITGASFNLVYSQYESLEGGGVTYDCSFSAMNSDTPFRAKSSTPKPLVQGPQTAVVVGPAGDEIYTDKYGRVKVQFHWDREGQHNENTSCWLRVSHPWAGKNWGAISIPRIGQEVIVDFLDGDPDQPIITGRVYNAEQMPPWDLPANATQSGILSRSSKGAGVPNANAIRMEDKKGAEQMWIHAEKNQDIEVENDETHWVGHDRKKTIDHDETTLVKHDRTETVNNNETITIGVNRVESVGSNETISIGSNRTETVGANETITIGSNRTISVGSSETATVALQRTHSVGVNETISVGAAQEITVGAAQAITVGAVQAITVGANQTVNVGAAQDISVGAARSVDVGANASMKVGADESRSVTGGRSTTVGKDDSLKVAKNLLIDAGDSVTIKTGSASITMKKDGTITIKGKDITIDGSGKINVKAGGNIVMKGSKILQN
ncbi:MAG: type VI secretion system Vgr family protein [Burkholderiales bacterium]